MRKCIQNMNYFLQNIKSIQMKNCIFQQYRKVLFSVLRVYNDALKKFAIIIIIIIIKSKKLLNKWFEFLTKVTMNEGC